MTEPNDTDLEETDDTEVSEEDLAALEEAAAAIADGIRQRLRRGETSIVQAAVIEPDEGIGDEFAAAMVELVDRDGRVFVAAIIQQGDLQELADAKDAAKVEAAERDALTTAEVAAQLEEDLAANAKKAAGQLKKDRKGNQAAKKANEAATAEPGGRPSDDGTVAGTEAPSPDPQPAFPAGEQAAAAQAEGDAPTVANLEAPATDNSEEE